MKGHAGILSLKGDMFGVFDKAHWVMVDVKCSDVSLNSVIEMMKHENYS